jgi:hypothetical protein
MSQVLVELEMESTVVDDAPVPNNPQLCYSTKTMPDVTLMDGEQLRTYCRPTVLENTSDFLSGALRRYFELALHKNPNLKILEIGSDSDSEASTLIEAIDYMDDGRGSVARISSYTVTRKLSLDLEHIKAKANHHGGLLEFKTLDLNTDLAMQGFCLGTYDLVLVLEPEVCHSFHNDPELSATNFIIQVLLNPHNLSISLNALRSLLVKRCAQRSF